MRPNSHQINKALLLKPYEYTDENRFVEMSLDEQVIKYMDGASGEEEAERALFQKIFTIYSASANTRIFNIWGIYKNDQLCGHLELKETADTTKAELEIVYMIHPAARRQGIMLKVLDYIKNNQTIWQRKGFVKVYLKTI